jgi:hypothetical protein
MPIGFENLKKPFSKAKLPFLPCFGKEISEKT